MSDTKQKAPKHLFTTPPGTARYPRLDSPDTKYKSDGTYRVTLRWPTEQIAALQAKVEALAQQRFDELRKQDKKKAATASIADTPFKTVYDDEGEPTGETEATFKLDAVMRWKDKGTGEPKSRVQRPIVADARGKPTKATPWTGSTMAVHFEARPDYWSGQKKVGVSLRLIGAQIIKLVQGSGKESIEDMGFDTYDDGFSDDDFRTDENSNEHSEGMNDNTVNDEDDGNF